MHHFVTEMCTYVHISVPKLCIEGYLLSDALWVCGMGSLPRIPYLHMGNPYTRKNCLHIETGAFLTSLLRFVSAVCITVWYIN